MDKSVETVDKCHFAMVFTYRTGDSVDKSVEILFFRVENT